MTPKELSEIIDNWTVKADNKKIIRLIGDQNSPYLKAVRKKAKKLGFTVYGDSNIKTFAPVILIADTETCTENDKKYFTFGNDIDCIVKDGLSSVAEAVYIILSDWGIVSGKHIGIVGRGHAVKGLKEFLINDDATVTLCHSKTKDIKKALSNCDVIVNSSPVEVDLPECEYLIDISKGTPKGLNSLNISILLHRAAHKI